MENKQIDVSVAILTYYHEEYIRAALDSVLSQKTDYTYEIVVGDDCSKDRTREILQEYYERYPDIITLVFNDTNLGISGNNYNVRTYCKGRYIATLSGDDYWIDDKKIQKQVVFLDSHPDYYATTTSIQGRFDNDEKPFATYPNKKLRGATIDLKAYTKGAIFGTNGMMMRNAYLSDSGREYFSTVKKASPYIDDATECILVLQKGLVYVFEDESVVYRVRRVKEGSKNFNSRYSTLDKCRKSIDLYNNLASILPEKVDLSFFYVDHLAVALAYAIISRNMDEYRKILETIPELYKKKACLLVLPRMIKLSFRKIHNIIKSRR